MTMTKPTLRVALLVFLVVVLLALASAGCAQTRRSISGALPYHEQRLTTPGGGNTTGFALELSAGDRLEGSSQQVGPSSYNVVFTVFDPNGKGIYNAAFKGKHDFVFTATVDGYYDLNFYSVASIDLVVKYRRT